MGIPARAVLVGQGNEPTRGQMGSQPHPIPHHDLGPVVVVNDGLTSGQRTLLGRASWAARQE